MIAGVNMANVIVVVGAGQLGQAIARRVGVGQHILLADLRGTTLTFTAKPAERRSSTHLSQQPHCGDL